MIDSPGYSTDAWGVRKSVDNPSAAHTRVCTACGTALPKRAKFCFECGRPLRSGATAKVPELRAYTPPHLVDKILGARVAMEGERKQVTVLFADVKGSME